MSESFGLTPPVLDYLARVNPAEHPVLAKCRAETQALGEPLSRMQISPEQGAFMGFLLRALRVRTMVEVGVFTGYSSLVASLAMRDNAGPGAMLYALDISAEYTAKAQGYWAEAHVANLIELLVAPAADSLDALIARGLSGKLDAAFIDADKGGYPVYFEKCLQLVRPGGVLLFDNMLRNGRVADPDAQDEVTKAIRHTAELITADKRVESCLIALGDGIMMARKL